ncbi:MAG: S41 family peptidase [Verrucomicrobiaceae bacterium]
MRCFHPSALQNLGFGSRIACAAAFAALSLSFAHLGAAAEPIQLASSATLSHDGKSLVLAWADDLWTAPTDGGEATRLTNHPAPDHTPLLSKDGKSVFFNSSRTGSTQVFRIPIQGGTPEQLTFHTEGNLLEDLHPQKDTLLVSGERDHAGRRPTRLLEKPFDSTKDESLLFDATAKDGRYSPDGRFVLLVRGGAPTYRKGYHGSQHSRIWLYDLKHKTFEEPVSDPSGCRYPVWAPDGLSFYYVTSRSGAFNIWQHRFGEKHDRQLTEFPNDSVFAPQVSGDGSTLVFRHLLDLYSLATKPGSKPEKIRLFHRATLPHPEHETLSIRSTNDATVTPSGLEWAFVAEGEIWAMDTVLKEPRRLTDSPAYESDIYFSEKGDHLYYLKDNGITANYWRMSKQNKKDFWWTADQFHHHPVTKGPATKSSFRLSPKGDLISYVEYPGTLWIAKPDGSEPRKLLEGWDSPDYVWSPDGLHLAYAVADQNFNNDIYIIATDGKSDPVNVSRHPDNEYSPRWSPDGKILAFVGRRHSTATDLFFVHLKENSHFTSDRDKRLESAKKTMTRDPLYKPDEKKKAEPKKEEQPKKEEAKEEKGDGKKKAVEAQPEAEKKDEQKPAEKEEAKEPVIDFQDIHRRIQRIPLNGLSPGSLHWMPDSKYLSFQTNGSIYRVEAKAGAKPATAIQGTGTIIRFKDNERIYVVSGGVPAQFYKGRLTKYSFSIPFARKREDYQRIGFRFAWRTMRDTYYDPALNHRDWDHVRTKYELAAAKAPTKMIYGRVMALLLGELNGSHLGFYPNPWPNEWTYRAAWRNYTPHLGVTLDSARTITSVLPNGPADRPQSHLEVGERIIAIDGQRLRSDTPLTTVLTGRLDRDIRLTLKKGDADPREVTIRPISFGQARALAHSARLDQNLQTVETQTEHKLGYLHVARMAWEEFEEFEHHLYERGAGKDGLIIDVRDNGGGFTADHLLTALTQPRHAFTVPRNGNPGYPQDRQVYASWHKPIVVLCNENSFSNAEIFSHAIKNLNRGKLIGIPTAGGVISTGSTNILGLGRMRLPFRGWFLVNDGQDMELHGAVPHHIVDLSPNDLPSGRDPQLQRAIEVLKQEVTEKSRNLPKPIYRSQEKK